MGPASRYTVGLEVLSLLFEEEALPRYQLPEALARDYAGHLGFPGRVLYANFVSSLDGVVKIPGVQHVGSQLNRGNRADRFVMGLLRACADAVLVGAETLRASPGTRWTAERAYPAYQGEFQALRSDLGRAPTPTLVVVSESGDVDPAHPGFDSGALLVVPEQRVSGLRSRFRPGVELLGFPGPSVEWVWLLDQMHSRGAATILSEAGPRSMGEMLQSRVVDEIFLTVSPNVVGQGPSGERRGFGGPVDLLGSPGRQLTLVSVRRNQSHLFLRYRLSRSGD